MLSPDAHSAELIPFPDEFIMRRVIPAPEGVRENCLPGQQSAAGASADPGDAVTVTQHGVTQAFDCEQDLHAAVLVACADLLQAREDGAVNRALVAQRRRLDAQAAAERMARRRAVHRLASQGILLCCVAGVVGALTYGVIEVFL